MNEQERQELAEHLAGMKYRKARRYLRLNFEDSNLKFFRNAVNREIHTQYEIPSEKIKVILVEEKVSKALRGFEMTEKVGMEYYFTEARVIEWEPPVLA